MRLYLDTSIIGGYFDREFKEWTIPLVKSILRNEHIAVFSYLTIQECTLAPNPVKELLGELLEGNSELIVRSLDAEELARHYISGEVLTEKYIMDALHIALASQNNVDALLSWNFKHIVNLDKIRRFNAINLKYGYKILEIRSQREIVDL